MNQKITDLIQGRSDGQELLNALDITESTKFCSKVEKAIKSTIELVNQGMSVTDAAAQSKGKASTQTTTAITQQDSTAIAQPFVSQEIPENVIESIGSVAREIGTGDGDELPDAIASYTQEASEHKDMGLKGVVQENYFAGLLESVQKPEFKDQIRESLKKLRAQTSKAK